MYNSQLRSNITPYFVVMPSFNKVGYCYGIDKNIVTYHSNSIGQH